MPETEERALGEVATRLLREWFPETTKHVFSHRIHLLSVCSARVEESFCPTGFEWWSEERIRAFGTTTWLLRVGVEMMHYW